jgi:hypothetical protein
VVARDLRVVRELALVSRGGASDKELGLEIDLLTSRVARDYAQ